LDCDSFNGSRRERVAEDSALIRPANREIARSSKSLHPFQVQKRRGSGRLLDPHNPSFAHKTAPAQARATGLVNANRNNVKCQATGNLDHFAAPYSLDCGCAASIAAQS